MKGQRQIKNEVFHRVLRSRREDGKRLTVTRLAQMIGCGRSHLSQVLNGRRSGGHTWRKLERVLTKTELEAVGRCAGTAHATGLEQCATGNNLTAENNHQKHGYENRN